MILFVRKYFHKNLMRGLILVTALSLVGMGLFTGVINLFTPGSNSVFSVNGIGVSQQLFALRVATEKRILEFYQNQLGSLAPRFLAQAGLSMSPEKNAYNKLLQESILSSCMDRSGLHINTRIIAQKAQDPILVMNIFGSTLPRSLYDRQGRLQQEILLRLLAGVGLSVEDFEKMLEGVAERELALDLFNLATPVTQKEREMLALKKYGTRHFSITFYTLSGYLKKAQAGGVSPEELQAFYGAQNAQSNRYWEPEKRQGVVWKIVVQEKNRTKLAQELQDILNNGSPEDFESFIIKHKGTKSLLKDQSLKQNDQQSMMLFKLDIDTKGMVQEDSSLTVIMPTAQTPATQKDFMAVSKQVEQDFYHDAAQKAFVADLEGAGISDQYKTTTKSFVLKPETIKKELEKLAEESVAIARLENMVIEGAHLRGVTDKGGYLLTLEKSENPQSLTPEQYLTLENEVHKENARLVTAASVDSLLKNAKIKVNKAIESSKIDLH